MLQEYRPLFTFPLMESAALKALTTTQTHYHNSDETQPCLRQFRPRTVGSWDAGLPWDERVPCTTEGPGPAESRGTPPWSYRCANPPPARDSWKPPCSWGKKNTSQTSTARAISSAGCACTPGREPAPGLFQQDVRPPPASLSSAPGHPTPPRSRSTAGEPRNTKLQTPLSRHAGDPSPAHTSPQMQQACPAAPLHPPVGWTPSRLPATRPLHRPAPPPQSGTYRRRRPGPRREQPPSAGRSRGQPGTPSFPSRLLSPCALPRQKSFGAKV